jgi:hypothetical protein
MWRLVLIAILTAPLGCAHHETRNVAQRQTAKPPRGDLQAAPRNDRRDGLRQVVPPIVTPPVP